MPPLTIRAHHLLCLSEANLDPQDHPTLMNILRTLKSDPDVLIRVVNGPDDICLPCPQWSGEDCLQKPGREARNGIKDRRFLERLGLKTGEVWEAKALYARIHERIDGGLIRETCATSTPEHVEACVKGLSVDLWQRS